MGSIDDAVTVLANPTDTMMNALKVLQNSATMQALMKKEPQNEVRVHIHAVSLACFLICWFR